MTLSSTIQWDNEIIQRYDLSGPRYTSYPTAPQFAENFPESEVAAAISRSNKNNQPLSLYFHIPFCDTICYYCGCNKVVTANKSRAEPYLQSMHKEIELRASQLNTERLVDQLHWGGGTPTFISHSEMRELMTTTGEYFALRGDDKGEYSVEVHPGNMEVSTVSLLRELGFNRLSMGVQDFNPAVQKAVNRFNTEAEVKEIVDRAREEGYHSLSMDLLYGLPLQDRNTLSETLEAVIELAPDRLSLFNYAHLPHLFKSQKQIDESTLPQGAEKLEMLHLAIDRLQNAGYVHIGMDHFARPDDTLAVAQCQGELQRNFQGYSTHGNTDTIAFGVSSISTIDNIYIQNEKDISAYQRKVNAGVNPVIKGVKLSADDLLRREVINELLCHFTLDFESIEKRFDIKFTDYFADALNHLQPMVEDQLISVTDSDISVQPKGRLLIRHICMAFDRYLNRNSLIAYSKII